MKFIIIIFTLLALNSSCKAQGQYTKVDLSKKRLRILKAFVNQEFSYRDSIYLNEDINQKSFSNKFRDKYLLLQTAYREADSICNNSLDTLSLKTNCSKAYNYKKYFGLFIAENLDFFEDTYKLGNIKKKVMLDIKDSNFIPTILNHTKKYYLGNDTINFNEIPSLKIEGIYLSEENEHAIIAYKLFPYSIRNGVKYGILKNEKNVWWRYIGSIRINKKIK